MTDDISTRPKKKSQKENEIKIHFWIFIGNQNSDLKVVFRLANENENQKNVKIQFHFETKIECPFRSPDWKHNKQDNRNWKYPIIISKIWFEIYSYIQFYYLNVVITDNLQNLKFYQRSWKIVNDNMMFCTKIKLLARKIVLKAPLFQIFCYIVQAPVKLRNSQSYRKCQL